MNELQYRYEVQLPLAGASGGYFTVVRALTPEGASECVKIILAQKDPSVSEVVVRVYPDTARM